MRRRVVAENRTKRDEDTRIPANRRTGNGVSHSRVGSAEDEEVTASQNWPTSMKESGEKGARRNQNFRRDREKIVFIALAISGAALIVVACFTFNLISVTADGRIIKIFPFLSDATTGQETRKEQGTTHSVATKKMPFFDKIIIDETHVSHHDSSIVLRFEMDDVSGYDDGSEDMKDYYYEFDDDYIRSPMRKEVLEEEGHVFEDEMKEYCCRRISEHRLSFPNCNTFHETPMLDSQATIIGSGAYRQAMKMELSFGQERETVVVKDIHLHAWLDFVNYEFSRMDAIVAERLTSSPRIYAIYGFCGIGILSETFLNGHVEEMALLLSDDFVVSHDETSPLICHNDLSPQRKLELALQMAEALADLHGYPGGPIVHQDVKLDQFFFSEDMSTVILNDFNRAEFLLWDECNKEYCVYSEGVGAGNWRSPEEYWDDWLDEKVDVYSMGNNMYTLLTGAMPFQGEDYDDIQNHVRKGIKPFIDPRYSERSLGEAKLVEIIEKCHQNYPSDRPTIFEVVAFLRDALKENNNDIES